MTVDRAPVLARSKRALPASQRPDKGNAPVARFPGRSPEPCGGEGGCGLDRRVPSGCGRILSTAKIRRLKRFRRSPAGRRSQRDVQESAHRAAGIMWHAPGRAGGVAYLQCLKHFQPNPALRWCRMRLCTAPARRRPMATADLKADSAAAEPKVEEAHDRHERPRSVRNPRVA